MKTLAQVLFILAILQCADACYAIETLNDNASSAKGLLGEYVIVEGETFFIGDVLNDEICGYKFKAVNTDSGLEEVLFSYEPLHISGRYFILKTVNPFEDHITVVDIEGDPENLIGKCTEHLDLSEIEKTFYFRIVNVYEEDIRANFEDGLVLYVLVPKMYSRLVNVEEAVYFEDKINNVDYLMVPKKQFISNNKNLLKQ